MAQLINCPFCNAENMEGSDYCEQCQHSLTELSHPQPVSAVEKGLLKDRIEVLRPREPLAVRPDASIGDVLKRMVAERMGCAVVTDEKNKLLGIFTERDALMRLNVDAMRMADKPVSTVITENPATLRSRDKIAFALQRMNVGGFRHIPILDDRGQLMGVISVRGILAYLTERLTAKG